MRQWEAQINYLKEAAIQRQLARSQIAGPKVHDLMRRGAAPRSQGSPSAHLPERQTGDLPPLNSPPHQLKVYQVSYQTRLVCFMVDVQYCLLLRIFPCTLLKSSRSDYGRLILSFLFKST